MATSALCPTCKEDRLIPQQWNPEHDECFRCWIGSGPAVHYPYGGRQAFKDRSLKADAAQLEKVIAKTHPNLAKAGLIQKPETARWV